MASFSDYTENLVLNWLFTANSATRPTAWYVGLFTSAPSDTGGGTEVSGSGYARTATGVNWGAIGWAAIFDASSGGNMLAWAPLTTSRTINDGDVFRIPASSLTVTLT